jgi:hypothetical protein
MGFAPGEMIEKAGRHLLTVLKEEGQVRYSRFYDGSEDTHEGLLHAFGLTSDWYLPELLMDLAVYQLARGGVVRTTKVPDRLADGENDYLIELTEEGRGFLVSGEEFRFRGVDL